MPRGEAGAGASEERGSPVTDEELPDANLLWQWVGKASRPVVGWVLMGAGGLAILAGYLGVSRESLVAKQIPYLVSGGILGMVLVAVGAFLLGTEDLRRELKRVTRLEQMVQDLHETLLVPLEAQAIETSPARSRASNGTGRLVTLSGSSTFHRPDCRMVEGKATRTVTDSVVKRRGLTPCRLCEPAALVDA